MNSLRCSTSELNLGVVLLNGQSFRWRKVNIKDAQWESFMGVAAHRVWRLWRENSDSVAYEVLARFSRADSDDQKALSDYFQLGIRLSPLYDEWARYDPHFASVVRGNGDLLAGVRILAQRPVETLFSFICSSNNNIKRISRMVERLCELYGEKVEVSSDTVRGTFCDFADAQRMAVDSGMTEKLKAEGFGYRAAYLAETARKLADLGGEAWLDGLATVDYTKAKDALLSLPGVGPKVADCICLMGLSKHDVVPVDTHVFRLTAALYLPHLKNLKALSKQAHEEVGDVWREKFGGYAGWAQSVLFSAQLRQFDAKLRISKVETKGKARKRTTEESTDDDEYFAETPNSKKKIGDSAKGRTLAVDSEASVIGEESANKRVLRSRTRAVNGPGIPN